MDRHETEHKTFKKPDETREFPHLGWRYAWTMAPRW